MHSFLPISVSHSFRLLESNTCSSGCVWQLYTNSLIASKALVVTIRHVVSAVASEMSKNDISQNKFKSMQSKKNEINQQSDSV